MSRIVKKIVIRNPQGLHSRPATLFVKSAQKFSSNIMISKDGQTVDAKSILNILSLGLEKGAEIELIIEGEDASQALKELEKILSLEDE